jgi:hypothetical protein
MGRRREPQRFSDAQIAATRLADSWTEEERLLRRAQWMALRPSDR